MSMKSWGRGETLSTVKKAQDLKVHSRWWKVRRPVVNTELADTHVPYTLPLPCINVNVPWDLVIFTADVPPLPQDFIDMGGKPSVQPKSTKRKEAPTETPPSKKPRVVASEWLIHSTQGVGPDIVPFCVQNWHFMLLFDCLFHKLTCVSYAFALC